MISDAQGYSILIRFIAYAHSIVREHTTSRSNTHICDKLGCDFYLLLVNVLVFPKTESEAVHYF